MASPAPGTLIMPSTEIMAKTSTSVTLRRTPQTAAIKRGQILVGDGRSGLLARVTKITVDTAKVTIFTVSASLASAFTGLSIETESVPISISMSPNAHNPADCKLPSGREADMKLAGSSVSVRGTVRLAADLQISHEVVKEFKLAVNASIPVTVKSGTVKVFAAGDARVTCDLHIPSIDVPSPYS